MRKYKIIIVENDEDEQFFMKEGFDNSGELFQIIAQVRNGDHLFMWLEQHPTDLPDLILSDLNMPGQNGFDIIDTIKKATIWSHIPVIITSTSSTKTIIDKCLQLGASDYIVKPDTFIAYAPYVRELYKNVEEKRLVK